MTRWCCCHLCQVSGFEYRVLLFCFDFVLCCILFCDQGPVARKPAGEYFSGLTNTRTVWC